VSKEHFIRPAMWVDLSASKADEGLAIGRDSPLRESTVIKGRSFKTKLDSLTTLFWNRIEEKESLAALDYVDSLWKLIDEAGENSGDLWAEGIKLYQRDYEMYINFYHGTAFSIKALTDDEDYITRVFFISPESLFYQTVLEKLDYTEQLQKFTVRYPASVLSALTNETLETTESVINKLLDGTASGNLSKDEQGNYYVIHNSVKCSLAHRTNGGTEYTFSVAYEMDSLQNNTFQAQDETEPEEVNPILFIAKTKKATNIREKADKKSNKITTINQKGKEVSVVEIVTGNDGMTWYRISLEDGTEGYARSDFFTR
jgi:hypothetical protein